MLRLQPDEGVKQWIMIKDPGPGGMRVRHVPLDMSFANAFHVRNPDAYERLLLDVIRGNQTLFMRRDEVEAAWRWVDPIREAWERSGDAAKALCGGKLGTLSRDRPHRARRPHLARGLKGKGDASEDKGNRRLLGSLSETRGHRDNRLCRLLIRRHSANG